GTYVGILKKAHVRQSMSRKGTPHDNAPTESVIHQLRVGTTLNHHYKTRAELESAIDNWIRYYNTKRIRSSNNWLTPNAMRLSYKQKIV
ncbi:integrase core domain-containing protein, partial [Companilactobacillus mishanensis]